MFKFFDYPNRETPLPRTRKHQFAQELTFNWRKLCSLSVLMLIFAAPFVAWMFISTIADSKLYVEMTSAVGQQQIDIAQQLQTQQFVNGLVFVPLVGLLFIGVGSAISCVKKMLWNQNLSTTYDFFSYVKEGWLGYLITGVTYCLVIFSIYQLAFAANTLLIIEVVAYVLFVFVTIVALFMLALQAYYKQNLLSLLKNAVILSVIKLPRNVALLALSLVFAIPLIFLPLILGTSIVVIIYALFGAGFFVLVHTCNACSLFDQLINKQSYPTLYKKGLLGESDER